MKEISENKLIAVNISATLMAFVIQACISFFLSPYIVKTIGVEAQGFVQLAANFASYVALVTVALNSMSGRFITVEIHKGNHLKAGQYYTSVFYGNLILFSILLLPLALIVIFLERIIHIPAKLIYDVKILFSLVFLNLFITNILSLWNNTFYIVNRIYLQSIGSLIVNSLNAIIIVTLFSVFPAKVYYSAAASMMTATVSIAYAFLNKKKYLPKLQIKRKLLSVKRLTEIISSGFWRMLQSTGEILLNGIDLLICNLIIDAEAMGVLALSKTLPMLVQGINWQIALTFAPSLTILYAKKNKEGMLHEMKRACKINAIVGTIPIVELIVFGREFFMLWMPGQDPKMLHLLSILACFWIALLSGVQPVGNAFAAANKVKSQALGVIVSGVMNTLTVFVCLKFTDLGIYAIAGTSTVIGLSRNLFYTIPMGAKSLGFKWNTFFFGFAYSAIAFVIVSVCGILIRSLFHPQNWMKLVVCCALTGAFGLMANTSVIFNKQEKQSLQAMIFNRRLK